MLTTYMNTYLVYLCIHCPSWHHKQKSKNFLWRPFPGRLWGKTFIVENTTQHRTGNHLLKLDKYKTRQVATWQSNEPLLGWCCQISLKHHFFHQQGPVSIWRLSFPGIGIPMLKIRWSPDRLIFNMKIPIPGKDSLHIEKPPWCLQHT